MWETYCFVNSFWNRLVLCLTSAMFYFLCLLFCFVLSFLCYAFLFYGISFDPALVNWNVQEPFILQTCYVRTPNISTMISLIRSFLSYFIIPIIFSDIFFQQLFPINNSTTNCFCPLNYKWRAISAGGQAIWFNFGSVTPFYPDSISFRGTNISISWYIKAIF